MTGWEAYYSEDGISIPQKSGAHYQNFDNLRLSWQLEPAHESGLKIALFVKQLQFQSESDSYNSTVLAVARASFFDVEQFSLGGTKAESGRPTPLNLTIDKNNNVPNLNQDFNL